MRSRCTGAVTDSLEPSFNYGGSAGANTFFVTGDYSQNNLGIESPDGSSTPLHDHTQQYHGFGYFEHIIDDSNRIAVIAGASDDHFEIPNRRGFDSSDVNPFISVNGVTSFLSDDLDERQREITDFATLSWQHSVGALTAQTSLIARYSSLAYSPDPNFGDLFFDGVSQQAYKRDVAYGLQSDAAYKLNESHTVRAGVYLQTDHLTSNTTSFVLPTESQFLPETLQPITDVPLSVVDDSQSTQWIESAYVQDEWRFDSIFTINYGVRFDHYSAFSSGSQLSPRVNMVWQATGQHHGACRLLLRFFSPPPFELVGNTTIQKFEYTTNALLFLPVRTAR